MAGKGMPFSPLTICGSSDVGTVRRETTHALAVHPFVGKKKKKQKIKKKTP
jgi:hypothetical protein